MTFSQRFEFESFWDGGVIEVSTDGGATWADISDYGDPGYNEDNIFALGRPGYSASSAGYPAFTETTINMGTALAGETIKVRFMIGTDSSVPAAGWEIDDLSFTGITNEPFMSGQPDDGVCLNGERPVADAGADFTVESGDTADLDGSGSSDPDGGALTYEWSQTDGPAVALSSTTAESPTFTAPDVDADTDLTFSLVVTDPDSRVSLPDEVVVTVVPEGSGPDAGDEPGPDAGEPPVDDDDGGGCCDAGGSSPTSGIVLGLGVLAFGLRRRRSRHTTR
jgi:hypothetical protein